MSGNVIVPLTKPNDTTDSEAICTPEELRRRFNETLENIENILNEMFQYEPLRKEGISAQQLKEMIYSRYLDLLCEIQIEVDPVFLVYLSADHEKDLPDRFLDVWEGSGYNLGIGWHEVLENCFIIYKNSCKRLGKASLFYSLPILKNMSEALDSIKSENKEAILRGLHKDATLEDRAKIPTATNILRLLALVTDYLEIMLSDTKPDDSTDSGIICTPEEKEELIRRLQITLESSLYIKDAPYHINDVLDELFEFKALCKEGIPAQQLREMIYSRYLDLKDEFQFEVDSEFLKYLKADHEKDLPNRFLDVWKGVVHDSTIDWHRILKKCSLTYKESCKSLDDASLFYPPPILSDMSIALYAVESAHKMAIERGIHKDATLKERAKIPSATNIIRLLAIIKDYFAIVLKPKRRCITYEEGEELKLQFIRTLKTFSREAEPEHIAGILNELFQYEPFYEEGIPAQQLGEMIQKRYFNPLWNHPLEVDLEFLEYLRTDHGKDLPNRFLNVWKREEYDPAINWHRTLNGCSLIYEESHKNIDDLLFIMMFRHLVLKPMAFALYSIQSEYESVIKRGIHKNATLEDRAKIPAATNMLRLLKLVSDYFGIVYDF